MELVMALNDDNMENYIKFIPRHFFIDYINNDNIFMYGIKEEGTECGIAVLEKSISDILIHYVYLEEDKSMLLFTFINTIAFHMYRDGYERMVWKFLDDEEGNYRRKLDNMGFVVRQNEIAAFRFSIKQLSQVSILNAPYHNVISLKDADGLSLKKLCYEISENGKDIIDMPINKDDFITECSVVYMEKNIPKGMMLLQMDKDNTLRIPFIYSSSKQTTAIIDMMRFMFSEASKQFDENMICNAYVVEPVLVKIIEKITGIEGKYQYVGIREFQIKEVFSKMTENMDII